MKRFKPHLKGSLTLVFGMLSLGALAQDPLDSYLREGLESNLALQQKNISLEQAAYALKIANSYFMPSLNFSSDYTNGSGGRAFDLPVGDLLNPAYSSLNQLTDSRNFPQIENVSQNFFPRHMVDAHVRAAMPLYNSDLHHNSKLQQDQVLLQEFEVKTLEKELVKNIKQAYYNYLSALEAVKIYQSSLELVERNLRVNQSLLKNGKGLSASVLRSESELENVRVGLAEAKASVQNARYYFNFLLNKAQDSPIESSGKLEDALQEIPQHLALPAAEVRHREELQMLQTGERMNQTLLRRQQLHWVPRVNAFIDLGAQAENWDWERDSRYYLMGVSLEVPLFNGFRSAYKSRQAKLGLKSAQLSTAETGRQLQMAAAISYNQLNTAWQNYQANEKRLQASQSYFKLIEKGYSQGSYSLIEFIDARNQLTTAQLQRSIQVFKVLSALAQYERETTSYVINPKN